MMNNFDLLPETDKVRLVLNKGTFVETISLRLYTIDLYALETDWVEAFISNLNGEIFHLGIISDESLDEYLKRIPIPSFI